MGLAGRVRIIYKSLIDPHEYVMAADLMNEIEALRSQIDALTKQLPPDSGAPSDNSAESGVDSSHSGPLGLESETVDKIKEQFDGFVDLIEKQFEDIPAGTAIAIFALGVLLGRLLPR